MCKIDINSNVKIYFVISWILGVVLILSPLGPLGEEVASILIIISFLNVFFNTLVIIFLFFMFFTFTENRRQFLHSLILLFINFPFIMFYCLLIFLITDNL